MSIAIPQHSLTIGDNQLGLVSTDAVGLVIIVGTSSTGSAGTFYSYGGNDVDQVFTDLGTGPLPDQIAKHLLRTDGKPVIGYKVTATTAGSDSAVTQSGSGPAVTLTLTPNNQYDGQARIVTGGAVGTSTFEYTLDGGDTWSEEYATAATFLLPSGTTLNFAAGTYVVDTTYSWTSTAPAMTSGDIGTALDAIIVSPYDPEGVHLLGQAATAADARTIATLLATKKAAAHAAKKYLWIAFEAPAVDKTTIISSFADFSDPDVIGCAGFAEIVSDATGSPINKRSSARVLVPRQVRQPLGVQIMRRTDDADLESLEDVNTLVPDGAAASTGYHDEQSTPGLNAARFCTLRTVPGRTGFYPTNGLTMAAGTSDYQRWAYRRIILQAARIWYQYGLTHAGRVLRKDPTTGFILEGIALAIENAGVSAIKAGLGGGVADAIRVTVNRADNLTNDPVLRAKVRLVLPGYADEIESEIALAPSLTV